MHMSWRARKEQYPADLLALWSVAENERSQRLFAPWITPRSTRRHFLPCYQTSQPAALHLCKSGGGAI
jgi:hypothetical protein